MIKQVIENMAGVMTDSSDFLLKDDSRYVWFCCYEHQKIIMTFFCFFLETKQYRFFLAWRSNSISFLIDDLSSSMQDKDFAQVKPAEELVENPAFSFLQ